MTNGAEFLTPLVLGGGIIASFGFTWRAVSRMPCRAHAERIKALETTITARVIPLLAQIAKNTTPRGSRNEPPCSHIQD